VEPSSEVGRYRSTKKEGRGKELKYIVYWEFCQEDLEKVVNKFVKYQKEHEKNPGKYQEYLYPPHAFVGQTKGFSIVEATPEQINNVAIYWTPELTFKYKAIDQSSNFVEQYLKTK
jgi:hypothetical protein